MDVGNSEISRLERADALGILFLRTMVVLNGGAILAVVTIIGGASGDTQFQFDIISVKIAASSYLLGMTTVLVALIVSYTFTATSPDYAWHQFWNRWIVLFNGALALISLISFVFGTGRLIQGSSATL